MKTKKMLLIGLTVLLAALAVGVLAAGRLGAAASSSNTTETILLTDFSAAELERFGVNYNGEELTFVKAELPVEENDDSASAPAEPKTEWQLENEPEYALDQSLIGTILTALGNLQATRQLSEIKAEYGLENPALSFWATANGQTVRFSAGAENTITGSLYLQKEGEEGAYLINTSAVASLKKEKAELAAATEEDDASGMADSAGNSDSTVLD